MAGFHSQQQMVVILDSPYSKRSRPEISRDPADVRMESRAPILRDEGKAFFRRKYDMDVKIRMCRRHCLGLASSMPENISCILPDVARPATFLAHLRCVRFDRSTFQTLHVWLPSHRTFGACLESFRNKLANHNIHQPFWDDDDFCDLAAGGVFLDFRVGEGH